MKDCWEEEAIVAKGGWEQDERELKSEVSERFGKRKEKMRSGEGYGGEGEWWRKEEEEEGEEELEEERRHEVWISKQEIVDEKGRFERNIGDGDGAGYEMRWSEDSEWWKVRVEDSQRWRGRV